MRGLRYTLLRPWSKGFDHRACADLEDREKELLLSRESMTDRLEEIFSSRVVVEPRIKCTGAVTKETAAFLGEPAGDEALERGVWLVARGRRIVYAHSIIPVGCTDAGLLVLFESEPTEPMGRILSARKVSFTKEALETGILRCPLAATDLAMDTRSLFFSRRYILEGRKMDDHGRIVIRAAIMEIFSPELVSVRAAAL